MYNNITNTANFYGTEKAAPPVRLLAMTLPTNVCNGCPILHATSDITNIILAVFDLGPQ